MKVCGAPGEIRTPDPLVRSQVLYPTELRARCVKLLRDGGLRPPRRLSQRAAHSKGRREIRPDKRRSGVPKRAPTVDTAPATSSEVAWGRSVHPCKSDNKWIYTTSKRELCRATRPPIERALVIPRYIALVVCSVLDFVD